MNIDAKPVRDCKICCVPHSDDIHEATLSIRQWLREEVTRKLKEFEPEMEQDPALVA